MFITFTQNFFKCSNVSVQFWNVLQTCMKCFTNIYEMFRNNLKYYPNKLEIFFNHSKHYEVFNTIYWKLFMFPNKSVCSGTLWNVPKESPQCFRTFSKCSNVPVQFWNVSPNISTIFYNHIWNILKQSEIFLNKPKNIF